MNTKLSDKQIQALKPQGKPYRVNDDNGLSCFVTPVGKKFWRFRYQWLGREKMLSMPNVTPHSLRHACGHELAMRGTDTRRLQVYLGHRSILSTVVYTDLATHATESVWC